MLALNYHRKKYAIMKCIKKFWRIIKEKGISIIWLVFTIIFLVLGHYHWQASKNKIHPFPIPHSEGKTINEYVVKQNKLSTGQNKRAAFGYWAAAATAVFSMCVAWPKRPKSLQ